DFSDKRRVIGFERLELVKQRIKQQRRKENKKYRERENCKPRVQPPSARAAANNAVEKIDQHRHDAEPYQLPFGPIPQPRTPALNRYVVLSRELVPIGVEGDFQHGQREEQQTHKNQGLHEPALRDAFGPISESGSNAKSENAEQQQERVRGSHEVKLVLRSRVRDRFLILLRRQGITCYLFFLGFSRGSGARGRGFGLRKTGCAKQHDQR